jgi:hypothetical protein
MVRAMKTARFADVVDASGRPDLHILLTRPEDDRALQAAIRSHRVMTVHQDRFGERADRGTVGFDPGPSRQFLIFPHSLSQFAGRFILAINYDLLKGVDAHASPQHPTKNRPGKLTILGRPAKPPTTTKIVPFREPAPLERHDRMGKTAADSSQQLDEAIGLLKQGKQASALRLLRKLARSLRTARRESANDPTNSAKS